MEPYLYFADVIRWVDGDTVELIIDMGFDFTFGKTDKPIVGRLVPIDTPERGEVNYKEATTFSKEHAPEGTKCLVRTIKVKGKLKDNFGRYFVIIYSLEGISVNDGLLASGLATIFKK